VNTSVVSTPHGVDVLQAKFFTNFFDQGYFFLPSLFLLRFGHFAFFLRFGHLFSPCEI